MKKSIYWLFLVVFALVLAVSTGAFRIIFIPAPSEEPLVGCAAERHDEVLDWCWKCGWPDSTNPYMKGDKILHNN